METRDRATWNLTEAKAKLSAVVSRALAGEPQRIVRNGHETVVVIAERDYRSAPTRTVVELFSALRGADLDLHRDKDESRDVPEL